MTETYAYRIDRRDVLTSVSDEWLQFAAENAAGASLTREAVCGRSLWDFVAGDETRELYQLLFQQVREQARRCSVPFRCDAPDRFRFMELHLAPAPGSGIELCGELLREQSRAYCALFDTALGRDHDYSFPACSVCRRVFSFGSWLEVDEAVRRLGAFDTSRPPGLEYTVCDGCRRLLRGEAPGSSAAV